MLTHKSISGVSIVALAVALGAAKPATVVSVGPDVQVDEGKPVSVTIFKTGPGKATFTFRTIPQSAKDTDFVSRTGTMTLSEPGAIVLQTRQDSEVEGPESFIFEIQPTGTTQAGDKQAQITIRDDDTTPPPQPIQCDDGSTVIPPATCPEPPPKPVTCWDMSQVTPPAVCPPEPPVPPSGNIPSNGTAGLGTINSVDPMLATKAAGIPGSGAPDTVGAFRFTCGFAGVGRFDPKVRPGDMTGQNHGHQFYGNVAIYPYSSYETLRTEGASTCSYGAYPGNRTAYWQPWLEDGQGHILQPDVVTVYYKRTPQSAAGCQGGPAPNYPSLGGCVAMPHGLFFIFGFDFLTHTTPTGAFDFTCQKSGGPVVVFKTLADAAADKVNCVAGATFSSRGTAPKCWNGTQVDSPNHRSHMGVMVRDNNTGKSSCDAAHPYIVPTISVLTSWTIPAGSADLSLWAFSSDYMEPTLPRGATFHVDVFQAWEPGVHDAFHAGCINQLLNCSSGNLGTGRMLNAASVPYYPDASGKPVASWKNPYAVIPIPGPEANTGLWGPSYGRAAKDWARRVKPGGKLPKEPPNGARERFERPGADPLIYDGAPAAAPYAAPVGHGERGQQ